MVKSSRGSGSSTTTTVYVSRKKSIAFIANEIVKTKGKNIPSSVDDIASENKLIVELLAFQFNETPRKIARRLLDRLDDQEDAKNPMVEEEDDDLASAAEALHGGSSSSTATNAGRGKNRGGSPASMTDKEKESA